MCPMVPYLLITSIYFGPELIFLNAVVVLDAASVINLPSLH